MTVYVFGKGDLIGFVKPKYHKSPLGSSFMYTSPSISEFFSKDGFALPLDYEAIPLKVWVEKTCPDIGVNRFPTVCSYLLIDRNGNMWKVGSTYDKEGNLQHSYEYCFNRSCGWWVHSDHNPTTVQERLFGFLYNDPKQSEIEKHIKEYVTNSDLIWLSIPKVLEILDKSYPIENGEGNDVK